MQDALCTKVTEQLLKARNYDDESHGKGASITTDPGNLQTDSGSHQFVPSLSAVIRPSVLGSIVELCSCVVVGKLDPHHRALQC